MSVKKSGGLWIPENVMELSDLNLSEKCVLALICLLDNDGGCIASNDFLSKRLGIHEKQLRRTMVKLEATGYISIIGKQSQYRKIKVPLGQKCPSQLDKNGTPLGQKCPSQLDKNGTPLGQKCPSQLDKNGTPLGQKCPSQLDKNGQVTWTQSQKSSYYIENIEENITYNIEDDGENRAEPSAPTRRKTTTPPTLSEIESYKKETGSAVDAMRFYNYYNQREWKGIKDWRSQFDSWGTNRIGKEERERAEKNRSNSSEKGKLSLEFFDEVEWAMKNRKDESDED